MPVLKPQNKTEASSPSFLRHLREAELTFRGSPEELADLLFRIRATDKKALKYKMKEFIREAFRTEELDDTQPLFTQMDILRMLDDFTDFLSGISITEIREKRKAELIEEQIKRRRELY